MNFCLIAFGFLTLQFHPGQGSSLPRQCTGVFCEEGTICTVTDRGRPSCKAVSTKPGFCPNSVTNPECLNLRGAPGCLFDTDCSGSSKCCRACCQEAVTQSQLDQARPKDTDKPGICPDTYEFVNVFWWTDLFCPDRGYIDQCLEDDHCEGADKCCPGLCGKECTKIRFDAQRQSPSTTSSTTTTTTTTTAAPTTASTTTAAPATTQSTTAAPTTTEPTTAAPTTTEPTTAAPTTTEPTTAAPTTTASTTTSATDSAASNTNATFGTDVTGDSSFNASHYVNKTSESVAGQNIKEAVDKGSAIKVLANTTGTEPQSNTSTTESSAATATTASQASTNSSTTQPTTESASTSQQSTDSTGTTQGRPEGEAVESKTEVLSDGTRKTKTSGGSVKAFVSTG